MDRLGSECRPPQLTSDQLEAIARQLPGRHVPDLARLLSTSTAKLPARAVDYRLDRQMIE